MHLISRVLQVLLSVKLQVGILLMRQCYFKSLLVNVLATFGTLCCTAPQVSMIPGPVLTQQEFEEAQEQYKDHTIICYW